MWISVSCLKQNMFHTMFHWSELFGHVPWGNVACSSKSNSDMCNLRRIRHVLTRCTTNALSRSFNWKISIYIACEFGQHEWNNKQKDWVGQDCRFFYWDKVEKANEKTASNTCVWYTDGWKRIAIIVKKKSVEIIITSDMGYMHLKLILTIQAVFLLIIGEIAVSKKKTVGNAVTWYIF